MNETLGAEAAYFKAIGITTEHVSDEEEEYLVSANTRDRMWSVVHSDQQIIALILAHEINIKFVAGHVLACDNDGTGVYFWQPYGEAQWQTKAWALGIFPIGMAVVRATTEKINSGRGL